jgi:hypothetical protein
MVAGSDGDSIDGSVDGAFELLRDGSADGALELLLRDGSTDDSVDGAFEFLLRDGSTDCAFELLRDGSTNGSSEAGGVLLGAGTGDGVVDDSIVAGNDVDVELDDEVALLRTGMGDGFIDEPMVVGNNVGVDLDVDVDDGTASGFLGIS